MPCKLWIGNKVFVLGQLFLAVSYMVTKYCSTEKSFHLPTQLNFFLRIFTHISWFQNCPECSGWLAYIDDFKVAYTIYGTHWCVSFVDQCLGQSEIQEEAAPQTSSSICLQNHPIHHSHISKYLHVL